MTSVVRAAALTNFERICKECGVDAHRLLAEIGLPQYCLHEPDVSIPAAAMGQLLELAAQRGNEPAFGVRMATTRRLSNLGALGLLVRDQPTFRHALEQLIVHMHRHADVIALSLVQDAELVHIRIDSHFDGGAPMRQATEMAMATTFRTMGLFLGEGWHPRKVTFSAPLPSSTRWHRHVFGDAIDFDHAFNSIVCDPRDLGVPNPAADPVMARYAQQLLKQDSGTPSSMSERVRHLIVLLMPRGQCRADAVALHLGMDRRTLSNHLVREGTNFKQLVDSMREELLGRYLKENKLAFSAIAPLLGFSELSAFSRWHRTQFGKTATQRRAV